MKKSFLSLTAAMPAIMALFLGVMPRVIAEPQTTSIAILNFDNFSPDRAATADHAWLRKGLADLLINDLATLPTVRVMNREQMQMLLQEANLQKKLLPELPAGEADKLRRYFVVDLILRGSYTIDGDNLTLQATLLRQSDSSPVARFEEKAPLDGAFEAQKALARQLIGQLTDATPAEVAAWPLPQWTSSITAAQLLYEGIDFFDQGDYLRAWYSFRQARQRDPDYADAAYWIARMYYYRTDYDHARPAYNAFVQRFPGHSRIGDAVMELIHSAERLSESPGEMLDLYSRFREEDWQDVKVHNQIDHLSQSPLSDWLAKRQQGALAYLGQYEDAYQVLAQNLIDNPSTNRADQAWQEQARDLLANLAMFSEDAGGSRLSSTVDPYQDIQLTLEQPFFRQDLDSSGMISNAYKFGTNHRILAPEGYRFKSLKAEVMRTNDAKYRSVCRLQIRRYRYVDIEACWTDDKDQTPGKRYIFDVELPPNATWLYLRPEYDGNNGNPGILPRHDGSFDGWRVDAEFEPLHPEAGGIELRVSNGMDFRALVDGTYARSRNGVIGNLAPGSHTLTIASMHKNKDWGFEPLEMTFEVLPGQYTPLDLSLKLHETSREQGWHDPVGLAPDYPTYKHSPRRLQNWRDGAPTFAANTISGKRAVVWSHLDDLWLSTSVNGTDWTPPLNLPAPINSAHVELNPRLLCAADGTYALLFLSDRGNQRSLSLYATTSHDLKHWSHPLLVSDEHYADLAFIQAQDGTFVVATVPGEEDPSHLEWRTSRDLTDWSPPRRLPLIATVSLISLTQDETGLFHLVWDGLYNHGVIPDHLRGILHNPGTIRGTQAVFHMTSLDLHQWNRPTVIPHNHYRIISVTTAVVGQRLWCALGNVDQYYSGKPTLALLGLELDSPGADWEEWQVPAAALSGLTSLAHDPFEDQLVCTWAMADMRLHAGRFSGPVFLMSGSPTASKPISNQRSADISRDIAVKFPGIPPPAESDALTALRLQSQPVETILTPRRSLRNDLANATFASQTPASRPPAPLRSFQWELLQDAPHPSTRLNRLTARHLNSTLQRFALPLATSDDVMDAMRERRVFSLGKSLNHSREPAYIVLGTRSKSPRVAMRMVFSAGSRYPGDNYLVIALTNEPTEHHYANSIEDPPAPLGRQLVLYSSSYSDETALEVGIAANNTTLTTWSDRNFYKGEHTLHLIQYDQIGEIFLNHQRLAVVPLDHPAQRPVFMIKVCRTRAFISELDIWELDE